MIVWLLVLLAFRFVGAPDLGPIEVIQTLNEIYQIELNVFVDYKDFLHSQDEDSYLIRETPMLQITTQTGQLGGLRLRGHFTEKTLVIVNLTEAKLDGPVTKLLPSLLDELHELHIVFLIQEIPLGSWQLNLFTYCYQEGFINVLLQHNQHIYSYLPYPSVQPIKLANISEYVNRKRELRNFRGLPIRSIGVQIPPRDFEYTNKRNEIVYTGYMYLALQEFIDRYNATYLKHPLPVASDFDMYGIIFDWLRSKRIDFVCYFKSSDFPVSYTAPLSIINTYFIAPNARPISSYLYYSKPFQWTVWLVVIATILYSTFMLYFVSRRDRNEVGECLLYCLSHIIYTCEQHLRIAGWRDVLVHVILIFAGFILTNIYLATLSSILTSGLHESSYTTLEDLAEAPYPNLHDDFYINQLNSNTFLPERLRAKAMSLHNSTQLDIYRNGLNSSYIYKLYEDRMELILMQQYLLKTPRFIVIRQSTNFALDAYLVSKSLPYLELVNEFMHRMREHGIFIKMKADTFQALILQGSFTLMRDDGSPAQAFDLEFYFFAFTLWAVGLLLSLVIFLMENLKFRYHNKRLQQRL
ncbi:hypothetical protein KR018_003417 [Drosophila ironensis]|nr:hypothetical protein KR018_003417 [Drosophila ironensis]